MRTPDPMRRYCHRFWQLRRATGIAVCTLRPGHGGTYCIDTVHNLSAPRSVTSPPVNPTEREFTALLEEGLRR